MPRLWTTGQETFLALLALPLCVVTARAQQAPVNPVVEAERVVVEGAPAGGEAGISRADLGAGGPLLAGSWDQVAAQVPNFQVEAAGTSSFGAIYGLRGLANTPYFSDPAITVYFDDIPLAGSFSYPTDLFGFASAAVYRGPQPTAFGRAGDGGVIVLTPPGPNGAGYLSAGLGSYDARSAAVEWSGAEGGRADGTFAAASTVRDGYIENTEIGQRVDDQRAATAFARERLRPTAASELSLEILADRHRDGAAPLVPLGGPLYTVERSQEGVTDSDMFGAALRASLDTVVGRFSSTTSYTDWRLDPYDDWLVLPPPLASQLTQSQRAWNEELRLASGSRPGLSWNLGAWASDTGTTGSVERELKGVIPLDATTYRDNAHDDALFGDLAFVPAPSWRVSVGARAEDTSKDYHQLEQVPTRGLQFHRSRTDEAFLPRVAVEHDVDADTTATASVSLGARPGGFSAYTDNPSLIPFKAEHTAAFEAGLRTLLAGKTVTADVRAFAYAIQNYQIERSFSAADYFVATAPRARSVGAEVEVAWRPSPGWTAGFNAGFADVTLTEFRDPLTGMSFDGNRAPYAPTFTAGLDAAYRSRTGWFGAARITATGKTFYTESENPVFSQPAYAVVSARAGFEGRRWRITAFVDNAADKGYYSLIIPGVNSAAPGSPRTEGAEAAVKF